MLQKLLKRLSPGTLARIRPRYDCAFAFSKESDWFVRLPDIRITKHDMLFTLSVYERASGFVMCDVISRFGVIAMDAQDLCTQAEYDDAELR